MTTNQNKAPPDAQRARKNAFVRPGDIVTINAGIVTGDLLLDTDMSVFTAPSPPRGFSGHMQPGDVAIVAVVANKDGRIYVVGPNGCGWTHNTYIRKVE